MYFIEFYQMSTGYVPGSIPPRFDDAHKQLIPACGDRSVIVVDGRIKKSSIAELAKNEAVKRGFAGYRVHRGESFTRSVPVSGVWPVPHNVDNSASSAYRGN